MKSAGRLTSQRGRAGNCFRNRHAVLSAGPTGRPLRQTAAGLGHRCARTGLGGLACSRPAPATLRTPPARPQQNPGTLPSQLVSTNDEYTAGPGVGQGVGKSSYSFATRGRAIRIEDGLPCTVRNTRIDAAQGHRGRPGRGQSELHPSPAHGSLAGHGGFALRFCWGGSLPTPRLSRAGSI